MKAKQVRDILLKEIRAVCNSIDQFCITPGKDFVRNRKIPIEKLMLAIIGMGSGNITNELLDCYDVSPDTPTASAFVQQRSKLQPEALVSMVDRSTIPKALLIADRGYESYNNMAHIQEKGWFFLIRIKDGIHGIKDALDLPASETYDVEFNLKLTRKQTKETKCLFKDKNHYKYISSTTPLDYLPIKSRKADPLQFYEIRFRIIRFPIAADVYETVVTNLNSKDYPLSEIKKLYASRWGIESSFRALKYTLGMVNFHSKKVACILQEIYAHLIMYNFAETVTSQVYIRKKQRKHTYKANFTVAVHMCRLYYHRKTTLQILETIIAKNLLPIRPDRQRARKLAPRVFRGFLYRVA